MSEGARRGTSFTFSLPIDTNQAEIATVPELTNKAVAFCARGVEDPDAQTVLVVEGGVGP